MDEQEKRQREAYRAAARGQTVPLANLLLRESDRGCVLVGGALLDEQLARLLQAVFRDPAAAKELLSVNGPLGPFATRIRLAHCLGLISPKEFQDLKLVCTIRNEAAHFEKKRGDGFDTGFGNKATQTRIREFKTVPSWFASAEVQARIIFIGLVMTLGGRFQGTSDRITQRYGSEKELDAFDLARKVVGVPLPKQSLHVLATLLTLDPKGKLPLEAQAVLESRKSGDSS